MFWGCLLIRSKPSLGGAGRGLQVRTAALGLILVGLAVILALNWPGHFSVDSVSQLAQGRTGRYDDWHPPIMAFVLGLADRLTPGAGSFVALDAGLFAAALASFVLAGARPSWLLAPILILVFAAPQVLVFEGMVWKDVFFADLALAGFGALAMAERLWTRAGARTAALAVAFGAFTLAAMARQAGVVVSLAGLAAAGGLAVARSARPSRALSACVVALAAALSIMTLAHAGFRARWDGQGGSAQQKALVQIFDLAGAAHLEPNLPLPALSAAAPRLAVFIRGPAARAWDPTSADALDAAPGARLLIWPPLEPVQADWMRLILNHPALYLGVRWPVFWATLSHPDGCPTISTGVQTDDERALAQAGLKRRMTATDDALSDYVEDFEETPVLSHLVFGALALALLAGSIRDLARGDRSGGCIASAALLSGMLAYAASFFFASLACDYRYLLPLDLAALAALVERCARGPQAALPTTAVARRSSLPQPTR